MRRKNLQREETLFQKKISPEKDVLKARQELGEAEADLNLAKERFRMLGVDVSQFGSSKGNGNHPLIPVTSPVGGVVIEKTITQGEMVNPEKTLFTVADLSTLWVVIDVYEKDISRLRVGTGVKVSVTAFPDKTFKGKISYIADVVDEKTRTEKARVTIDNASGLLKPGMFATVLDRSQKRRDRTAHCCSGRGRPDRRRGALCLCSDLSGQVQKKRYRDRKDAREKPGGYSRDSRREKWLPSRAPSS